MIKKINYKNTKYVGNVWILNPDKNKHLLKCVGYNHLIRSKLYTYEHKINFNKLFSLFGDEIIIVSFDECNNKIKI